MALRFHIVVEGLDSGGKNLSAFVVELPGCIATGRTLDELKRNMKDAIKMHIEGMKEDGEPLPKAVHVEEMEVA